MQGKENTTYLGVGRLSTKVGLFGGGVDVAVRCALEVGLFGENEVEEIVIEFVEDVDEDWVAISEHTQRGRTRATHHTRRCRRTNRDMPGRCRLRC